MVAMRALSRGHAPQGAPWCLPKIPFQAPQRTQGALSILQHHTSSLFSLQCAKIAARTTCEGFHRKRRAAQATKNSGKGPTQPAQPAPGAARGLQLNHSVLKYGFPRPCAPFSGLCSVLPSNGPAYRRGQPPGPEAFPSALLGRKRDAAGPRKTFSIQRFRWVGVGAAGRGRQAANRYPVRFQGAGLVPRGWTRHCCWRGPP